MSKKIHPPIQSSILEGISKTLGDTGNGLTGTEIGKFLRQVSIPDIDSSNTKWRRIYHAFIDFQNKKQYSNNIYTFISESMQPARFIGKNEQFEYLRGELNKRLSFISVKLKEDGGWSKVEASKTITEAEQRANRLKNKLEQRNAHEEIFKFCKAELLAENYFHTVFEATKSIAQIIRDRTGLIEDGSALVDKAFSLNNGPLITINDLSTETKKSEHKGFVNLLKGVFGMFRNPIAHSPSIIWEMNEQDALDMLSTISLIHRKLAIV